MSGEIQLTVVGNLTSDPELRYTQGGVALASFTVANTPKVFDKVSGEWKDGESSFLRCTAWRDLAENVAQSLHKGTRVIVSGRFKQRSYETAEGEKRSAWDLDVDEIGPSLRWATAQVVRAGGASRGVPVDRAERSGPVVDEWPTPGSINDDTPF
jgi:single-strand DNA-binding protein